MVNKKEQHEAAVYNLKGNDFYWSCSCGETSREHPATQAEAQDGADKHAGD